METVTLFNGCHTRGTLSHAYCFWGYGDRAEREQIAEEIAALLEKKPFLDCYVLRPQEGEIGIDQVREAQRFLWTMPARASRKTLIIHEAETMNTQAQNALLKIVEEPPEHGLILATVRDPELLVSALRSRFQKVFISAKCKAQIAYRTDERVERFLISSVKEKKEMIKQVLEEGDAACAAFVEGLMAALAQDTVKNYRALGELSHRWMLMQQFQTNRKLQLEAVLAYI